MNNIYEKILVSEIKRINEKTYLFDFDFYRLNYDLFKRLLSQTALRHKLTISQLKSSLPFPMGSISEDACIDFYFLLCLDNINNKLSYITKRKCTQYINQRHKSFNMKLSNQNLFSFCNLDIVWPFLDFKCASTFFTKTPFYLKNLNKRHKKHNK